LRIFTIEISLHCRRWLSAASGEASFAKLRR
jgi:hypothetical protein